MFLRNLFEKVRKQADLDVKFPFTFSIQGYHQGSISRQLKSPNADRIDNFLK